MEPWQVFHINKHLLKLVDNTVCDGELLSFMGAKILSAGDKSELEAIKPDKRAQSKRFFEIIITREGAYDELLNGLTITRKTGTLAILQEANAERHNVCFNVYDIDVSNTWSDFSDNLKRDVGNKRVIFQGKSAKLIQCCSSTQLDILDGPFLVELCKENAPEPVLVTNEVPPQVPYYISRTLQRRNKLNPTVFQNPCIDVFLIQGLTRIKLMELAGNELTDDSKNQKQRSVLTRRFILLESEESEKHFKKISELAKTTPVHWISYQNGTYELVRSSGSVANLQEFLKEPEPQDTIPEKELISRNRNRDNVFVISDSPGMGKTMLAANIAQDALDQDSDEGSILVRFIIMKEIAQAFERKEVNINSIISFIAEQSSKFSCGKKIVKSAIESGRCILIFDGFDEVLEEQVKKALKILETVSSTLRLKPTALMMVTTRLHMLQELENSLHVFSFKINPFQEEDKLNFLLRLWKSLNIEINEDVEKFAEACLNALTSNMTDDERDIAGIPLQCRLLAEIYEEDARSSSTEGYQEYPDSIGLITSIFDVYKKHMKMRLSKICENKSIINTILTFVGITATKYDCIKHAHMHHALTLLFPNHNLHFQSLASNSFISMYNHLCGLGILEGGSSFANTNDSKTPIRFVHRTFAEYLVAWFAIESQRGKSASASTTQFILSEILGTSPKEEHFKHPVREFHSSVVLESFKFKFPTVSYFINGFTKKQCLKENLDSTQIARKVSSVINLKNEMALNAFTAAAFHNYAHVPLTVCKCLDIDTSLNKTTCLDKNLNILELLLITAKYSDVELMQIFCPYDESTEEDSINVDLINVNWRKESFFITLYFTPLHVAMRRGHRNLVEYLIKKKYKDDELAILEYLIHYSVFNTIDDNMNTINCIKEVIELLLMKSRRWLNKPFPGSNTGPLLQTYVHADLVEHLIKEGADVNECDRYGNNILKKVTLDAPVTPKSFHQLVLALNNHSFQHFNTRDNYYIATPLFYAVKYIELLEETLKIFINNGCDLNEIDSEDEKETPLFYAIRGGRSARLISLLIKNGAKVEHVNEKGQGVLHVCAEHGNYESLLYFLVYHLRDLDVNLRDKNLYTPLLCIVVAGGGVGRKEPEKVETMLRPLLNNGADVDSTFFKELFNSDHKEFFPKVSTIWLFEDKKKLIMDSKTALEAFKALLRNTSIEPDDPEFRNLLEYLITKRENVNDTNSTDFWNPWILNEVQKNMEEVFKVTQITSKLTDKAKELRLLDEKDIIEIKLEKDSLKPQRFYLLVQEKIQNSFERVCLCLLFSNQVDAFKLLQSGLNKACPAL
ncbi:unnamed protein product [Orchesella dallaii]|uniref:NACHT domain-containing protein n=1 Tax=Orchesella dallaii TaxID=48710 RepID=A0ABP1RHR8_9HEXA